MSEGGSEGVGREGRERGRVSDGVREGRDRGREGREGGRG